MKIIICGGSGLIGRALVRALSSQHQITVVGHALPKLKKSFADDINLITWAEVNPDRLAQCDVVINLVGANVGAKNWTAARKQTILSSRVETTQKLANYCSRA